MFTRLVRLTQTVNLAKTGFQYTQVEYVNYKAYDLWKSVLMVSNQGSKKGRGKRGNRRKDLNLGQNLGDGKLQIEWPGLNKEIIQRNELSSIRIIGEDKDREKRLAEIRNKMDKFKRISIPPHERGFTGSSLAGKSVGAPVSYDDVDFSKFDTRIIHYQTMISHKSILGKKKVISCFVITGNGAGIIGYGKGKGSTAAGAIRLAKVKASQRLLYINLYENRTLFHNFYEEYYFTKIYAEKMPAGYGLVCHRIIKKLCELVGVKDVYAKVEGSTNPKNIVKAFISGLLNQKSYQEIANEKNLHVVEIKPEMKGFPVLLAKADNPIIEDKLQSNDYQKNIDLYLFQNNFRGEKKQKKPFYYNYQSYKRYCETRDRDNLQLKARIERAKLIPEQSLVTEKYPRKPPPKDASAESTD